MIPLFSRFASTRVPPTTAPHASKSRTITTAHSTPIHRLHHNPLQASISQNVRTQLSLQKALPIDNLRKSPLTAIFQQVVVPEAATHSHDNFAKLIEQANTQRAVAQAHESIASSSPLPRPQTTATPVVQRQRVSEAQSQVAPEQSYEVLLKTFTPEKPINLSNECSRILSPEPYSLDELRQHHMDMLAKDLVIQRRIDNAVRKDIPTEAKIKNLEHLLLTSESEMSKDKLTSIFNHFWDLGAYDKMVEMMDNALHEGFKTDPINLEFYARALMKSAYFNPNNVIALANIMLNRNETPDQWFAILGHVYFLKGEAAKNMISMLDSNQVDQATINIYNFFFPEDRAKPTREIAVDHYNMALANAIVFEQQAFYKSYDPRYGIHLVHRLLESGNTEEAKRIATILQIACKRDGVENSNNISLVRAYLESLYVLNGSPETIYHMEKKLLACATRPSHCTASIESLNTLSRTIKDPGIRLRMQLVCEALTNQKKEVRSKKTRTALIAERKRQVEKFAPNKNDCTKQWEAATYDMQGKTSHHIEGNFRFRGQLATQNINRQDKQFFQSLMKVELCQLIPDNAREFHPYQRLEEIQDPVTFSNAVDYVIRKYFHIEDRNMERLDSKEHKFFDAVILGLFKLLGLDAEEFRKMLPDSRTNISIMFGLGIGDCRHTALAKQLLFDLWKENQINILITEFTDPSISDSETKQNELQKRIDELIAIQLKILDAELIGQVAKKQDGAFMVPKWSNDHLVLGDKETKIEEHTMNVLFRYGDDGNITSVSLCDPFYHKTYPLQAGDIPFSEQDFSTKGPGVEVATVSLYDETKETYVTTPLRIRPTAYAGARDVYDRGRNQLKLAGFLLPGDPEFSLTQSLLPSRFEEIIDWLAREADSR